MRIPVYLINLDRSVERLNAVIESAKEHEIDIRRVPAVDGRALTPEQWAEIDVPTFERINGKKVLPAEVGCYLSHLKCLEAIADGPDDVAVIIEDDVAFSPDFVPFVRELGKVDGWDLVKLTYHRAAGYLKRLPVGDDRSIGRCLHGPLASGAAYAVTRQAARKYLTLFRPMVVPVDVELERGWAHGMAVFTVDRPVVEFTRVVNTIAEVRAVYKSMKFPMYRRIGTLFYRASEYLRRVSYALMPVRLSRNNDAT